MIDQVDGELRADVSLAPFTTFGVGGRAAQFGEARTRDELLQLTQRAWRETDEWLLLGGGSNVLISDDDFEGAVVLVRTEGIEQLPSTSAQTARIRIAAGESWDDVVDFAVRQGLAGIETLSGIPGSTGAAPVQNIGAYGEELSSTLVAIEFVDEGSRVPVRVAASELELGYRTSALKQGRRGVVVSVELELIRASRDAVGQPLSQPIAYAQLADALGVHLGERAPLAEVRRAVRLLRSSKGMVLDPTDRDTASAGSFFTNPIVSENFARGLPADLPRWPQEPAEPDRIVAYDDFASGRVQLDASPATRRDGYLVKLSAAWLIEHAGLQRGFALPGSSAGVSSKHTLALTNRGGASADEIAQLASFVQQRVQSEFGVLLQPEPVLVGLTL